jgi:hypothetical protein
MTRPALLLLGICAMTPAYADSNPIQPGTPEFTGSGGKPATVSGRIVAAAESYSDTQNVKKEGDALASSILDIINGLRVGPCAN